MRLAAIAASLLVLAALATSLVTAETENASRKSPAVKTVDSPVAPTPISHSSYMSPHASPLAINNGHVFVVNTPDDTVDIIQIKSRKIVGRVKVGIDPVGIAARPDGKEVWVTNHVSDSVSIIDTEQKSKSYLQVIATVQRFHPTNKSTRFDEPVGIAFASNDKAYVALSSENAIAVINVAQRKVTKLLPITAQDPRAITVQGDRLYVIPFESNNKSQLSGGTGELDKEYETFDAWQHSIAVNNVLSLGHVTDIIKHPEVPDRDLYVFDTNTDELVEVVDTLGTLLYGLTVDSNGKVFIAQADARNDANGNAGTKKHGLKELENRAFLNQITSVTFKDGKPEKPHFFELEPLPPNHPERELALATPFAIQISDDDTTLVASAASSDTIFTLDAATGEILGRVQVDAVPRGIALQSDSSGKASQAWVLNAVANTVSLLDVSNPAKLKVIETIALQDSTDSEVKRGRIAFNTAAASTTGTYSCASCHPDGHTDQLLWVLNTPIVTGGNQIMPRSTMPIRGLRDTEPYHWDGIPGDPYGGNNSANIRKHVEPNSDVKDPVTSARHLIDGGLATTMMTVGDKKVNDKGQSGELTDAERDAMAKFILSVTYPPAQRRSFTNEVSAIAREGFELFHVHGDLQPKQNVCGDCHRMPFLVSTNTPGTGMEAPTWRGAYDRWLILPQGRLNIIDFDFYRNVAEKGAPERSVWQFSWAGRKRFDPVWDMVLEGSTGFSGAFARQVTLNKTSVEESLSLQLLDSLEQSAREGGIVLEAEGVWLQSKKGQAVNLQFDGDRYVETSGSRNAYSRDELISFVSNGEFIGTFTGQMGSPVDLKHPQPALWTLGSLQRQSGRQRFPVLHEEKKVMGMSGRHFGEDAHLIVDGRRVDGKIEIQQERNLVLISFEEMPSKGMRLLQVQNPNGLFSNDFIFYVKETPEKSE
jgi:YVTN family beta-propeller protein